MSQSEIQGQNCSLIGHWIGDTFGTHRCQADAICHRDDGGKLIFSLHVSPTTYGVSRFIGTPRSEIVEVAKQETLILHQIISPDEQVLAVTLFFQATSSENIEAEWIANDNSRGILHLTRYKRPSGQPDPKIQPTEIVAKEYSFEGLRLFKGDIEEIIRIMEQLVIPDGNLFITYEIDGVKKTTFAHTYLQTEKKQSLLETLSIAAQRNVDGFVHSLVLNIRQDGISTLFVQSTNLFWFYNTPMAVKELLEKRSSEAVVFYKKHGLSINFFILLALVVYMPSIDLAERIKFIMGFIVFATLHVSLHKKFSKSIINQKQEHPTTFKEKHPTLSYISLTIISALIGALSKYGLEHWGSIESYIAKITVAG
jgi:hypothetical protein